MEERFKGKGDHRREATIEHFDNDGPLDEEFNIAYCCRSYNASKFTKKLSDWFKTGKRCKDEKINIEKVAGPVKEFIIRKFISRYTWKFAKTMPEIPHNYIVRDPLTEDDKKIFDIFNEFIKKNGYTEKFYSKEYKYYNIGEHKYWVDENILNRAELDSNNSSV